VEDIDWSTSEIELAFLKGWRHPLSPQHSLLYKIGLNKAKKFNKDSVYIRRGRVELTLKSW